MTDFPTDPSSWDIESHRAELAARLPALRGESGAPLGEDTDIVAMSVPPYATACPNPDLAEWVRATTRTVTTTAVCRPRTVHDDISVGKSNPFYKAHSYPTKVPHPAIMRFILHYTKPGDLVLDGFCAQE